MDTKGHSKLEKVNNIRKFCGLQKQSLDKFKARAKRGNEVKARFDLPLKMPFNANCRNARETSLD